MNAKYKKFIKERDEMLKKCDVAELEKFIRSHTQFLPNGFAEMFNAVNEELKQYILHKLIVSAVKLPKELRDKSALWLITRGYAFKI